MAINYFPKTGSIYMCDFKSFKEPEMVKVRPVIVISPKLPFRSEIVAIVPMSTTAPRQELEYCYRLSKNYMPNEQEGIITWAKCDMVINLAKHRLSAIKVGRRKYIYPELSESDLRNVKQAVLYGLGLGEATL